jgi:hypothetical protein
MVHLGLVFSKVRTCVRLLFLFTSSRANRSRHRKSLSCVQCSKNFELSSETRESVSCKDGLLQRQMQNHCHTYIESNKLNAGVLIYLTRASDKTRSEHDTEVVCSVHTRCSHRTLSLSYDENFQRRFETSCWCRILMFCFASRKCATQVESVEPPVDCHQEFYLTRQSTPRCFEDG